MDVLIALLLFSVPSLSQGNYKNQCLAPDFGASSVEAYGRCTEKHAKTQHLYIISPLMKKCLNQMKEHTENSYRLICVQLTVLQTTPISTELL